MTGIDDRVPTKKEGSPKTRLRVGILGATGAVGQMFVRLLQDHPWFELTHLAASTRSAGMLFGDAVHWLGPGQVPASIRILRVKTPEGILKEQGPPDFVFSGLDSRVAGSLERAFAEKGIPVLSNARNHRLRSDVPLLIPEINPEHCALIDRQTSKGSGNGFIVTNPNCSTVGLTLSLAPLRRAFGIEAVQVTTLQALSGAGYPGVSALDATGNVVPFISGEEDKLATEPLKLFGRIYNDGVRPAGFVVAAQCTRVPVVDGHLLAVSVRCNRDVSPSEAQEAFESFCAPDAVRSLPSAPDRPLELTYAPDRPQPLRDVGAGGGMTVTVGRVRQCEINHLKYVALVHNTIRGAAGGAILNAEYLTTRGYLTSTQPARAE